MPLQYALRCALFNKVEKKVLFVLLERALCSDFTYFCIQHYKQIMQIEKPWLLSVVNIKEVENGKLIR